MVIKVIAFGIARDIIGGNDTSIEVQEGVSVRETLELLKIQYADFEKLSSLRLAVNESYVEDDFMINEGDELVLIPPVSGG